LLLFAEFNNNCFELFGKHFGLVDVSVAVHRALKYRIVSLFFCAVRIVC